MNNLYKFFICLLAGAGAGIGTGFAGMSAAAVIGPMLITFLDIPAYIAVGVGLASDVLASAISAYTYKRNGNLDIKNGLVMMIAVLIFTLVGSFVASFMSNTAMGSTSVLGSLFLGIRFIVNPVKSTKQTMANMPKKERIIKSIIGGICIGFICGFVGAGGGMMMLLVLTSFLGYELKTAVGTSVFVMTFTALTGATSHFSIGGLPDASILIMCIIFTFIFARLSAIIANKASAKTLNRITGIVLVTLSIVVLLFNYVL